MHEQDSALNNQQQLICYKTKACQTKRHKLLSWIKNRLVKSLFFKTPYNSHSTMLRSVKSFIAITPRSTPTRGRTTHQLTKLIDQIDQHKNCSYLIESYMQKKFVNTYESTTQKCKHECTSLTSRHDIVDMPLKSNNQLLYLKITLRWFPTYIAYIKHIGMHLSQVLFLVYFFNGISVFFNAEAILLEPYLCCYLTHSLKEMEHIPFPRVLFRKGKL